MDGKETPFGTPQTFEVAALNLSTLPEADRAQLLAFQQKAARLQRAVLGAIESAAETQKRIDLLKRAIDDTPAADPRLAAEVRAIERAAEGPPGGAHRRQRHGEALLPDARVHRGSRQLRSSGAVATTSPVDRAPTSRRTRSPPTSSPRCSNTCANSSRWT